MSRPWEVFDEILPKPALSLLWKEIRLRNSPEKGEVGVFLRLVR